jgi:hypothetical protein
VRNRKMKSFESEEIYLGKFWVPDSGEEMAVDGAMTLKSGKATVTLTKPLGYESLEFPVIFARLQGEISKATLFNCFGMRVGYDNGGFFSVSLSAEEIALGCHEKNVWARAFDFRIPGSERWLNERCFSHERLENDEESIRFFGFEKHKIKIKDGFYLVRTYSARLNGGYAGAESYLIERPLSWRILSETPMSLGECFDYASQIKSFFEFMLQCRLKIEEPAIFFNHSEDMLDPDAYILFDRPADPKDTKLKFNSDLVFSHAVRDRIEDLLVNWLKIWNENPAVMHQYFHAFQRERKDPVLHFVWYTAVVEELHKLRNSRKGGNLIDRLKETRDRWMDAFSNIPPDEDLERIKDSRHYHAHGAQDLREKAALGWHLLRYGDFLWAIANLEILSMLGLSEQEAIEVTRDNHWMQEALNLTMYPGKDL